MTIHIQSSEMAREILCAAYNTLHSKKAEDVIAESGELLGFVDIANTLTEHFDGEANVARLFLTSKESFEAALTQAGFLPRHPLVKAYEADITEIKANIEALESNAALVKEAYGMLRIG